MVVGVYLSSQIFQLSRSKSTYYLNQKQYARIQCCLNEMSNQKSGVVFMNKIKLMTSPYKIAETETNTSYKNENELRALGRS